MAMYVREVPCEICDTVEDVNNFCLNCKQKFCDNCKKGHLRTSSSVRHKFAPIGDSVLPSSQKNEFCSKHQQENQFYCKTCAKVACSICLEDFHQNHNFSVLSRLAEATREEITAKLTSKEKELEAARSCLLQYSSAVESCRAQSNDIISNVKSTIKGWMDDLKSFEDEVIEATKKAADKEIKIIERNAEEMESKISKSNENILDMTIQVRNSNDASLLDQKANITSSIDSIAIPTPIEYDSVLPPINLNPSSKEKVQQALQISDTAPLKSAVETVVPKTQQNILQPVASPQSTKLRDSLKVKKTLGVQEWVYDIAPVTECKAWLGTTNHVMLVNTDAKILLQQPHGTSDGTSVTSTSSGDALYISSNTAIGRIDQNGKVTKFADLKQKMINHVRASKVSEDVYVATDKKILRMSSDGTVKNSLVCAALAFTELNDGSLVAINTRRQMMLMRNDSVTVLNISIRWEWRRFVTALSSDSCHRIMIGNTLGKQLNVYKFNGQEMELQREYKVDRLYILGLATDRQDQLWIAQASCGVTIAKYTE